MVAMIGGVDNGSFFVPFGVLTFWRPFARFLFYRKHCGAVQTVMVPQFLLAFSNLIYIAEK
jgi:hypothetical protein